MRGAWILAALALLGACRSAEPAGDGASAESQGADAARAYEVVFTGNETFSGGTLRDAIAPSLEDFEASGLERSYVDDAAFDLELFYRSRGFPEGRVDYDVEREGAPPVRVTFEVREGPRAIVAEVAFAGNRLFTAKELRGFLEGRRTGLFSTGDLYYQASAARGARDAIVAAYLARGYLDVEVTLREPSFSADRTEVRLTYDVDEGPAYWLGEVVVLGEGLDDAGWRELVAELEDHPAQPYDPRAPFRMKSRLLEALGAEGYPDATVDVTRERSAEDGRVDVTLGVARGPLVTLEGVRFEGREEVREKLLREILDVEVGEPVDTTAIREGIAALYGTGFFKRVGHRLVPVGEDRPDARELVVSVEEDVPIELFVEPGYGSYEGARLKIGIRQRNLFDRGLDLTTEGKVSQRDLRGRAKLANPRFLGLALEAGISLTAAMREEPTFTSREVGGGLFLTRRITARSSLTGGYQLRSTDASDVDVTATATPSNDVDISSVSLDYRYDSRRSILRTSAGFYGAAGIEYGSEALRSDLDFTRLQAQIAWFGQLAAGTWLGARFRGGLIQPHGGDQLPVQEQFFNGGQNTVRSFRQSELARDPMGVPFGGEAANTLSVELRQNLIGDLEGALFYDVGNVSLRAERPFDDEFLGQAYGVGLRYVLPIGAVRVDLGINPDPGGFDEDFVIHFAVGNPF